MKWHKTESMHVLRCSLFDASVRNSNENDGDDYENSNTDDVSGDGNDDDDGSNSFPDGKSVTSSLP